MGPNDLASLLTFRTALTFASTAFSILLIMLVVNIISVDDVVQILNLSPEAANALHHVVARIQEVTNNILEIISKLLTQLFSWAGADVDLTKIQVDVHKNPGAPTPITPDPGQ